MSQIDRTGTYRWNIVGCGIKADPKDNTNNVVQWHAQLLATEYYDEETEQWLDWSEYETKDFDCYLTLVGKQKQRVFHIDQLQKVVGWPNDSWKELDSDINPDILNIGFQGRIGEEIYEGKTQFKMAWVDHYDAEPGRTLQKLDEDSLTKLDAKFAPKWREWGGGTKPKSVEKVSKEDAKAAAKAKVVDRGERGKAAEAKAAKGKGTKPSGPPKPPAPPKPQSAKTEQCDKGQAWIDCCKERGESVTDQQLETAWHTAVDNLGGEDAIEAGSKWGDVRDMVIEIVNKAAA